MVQCGACLDRRDTTRVKRLLLSMVFFLLVFRLVRKLTWRRCRGRPARSRPSGRDRFSSSKMWPWEPSSSASWNKRFMFCCWPQGISSPSESSPNKSCLFVQPIAAHDFTIYLFDTHTSCYATYEGSWCVEHYSL